MAWQRLKTPPFRSPLLDGPKQTLYCESEGGGGREEKNVKRIKMSALERQLIFVNLTIRRQLLFIFFYLLQNNASK